MFTWILIILAVAFIFGVIKIEHIKDFTQKYGPKARNLLNKAKNVIEEKTAELKKNNETKKTETIVENQTIETADTNENKK